MLATKAEERGQYEMICIEELVPKDHILRKIESAIDFTYIYDWHIIFKKNSGGSKTECSVPLVFRISSERADTAFFNTQL